MTAEAVRSLLLEEEHTIIACVRAKDLQKAGCGLEFGENLDPQAVRNGLDSYAVQFRKFSMT